MRPAIPRPVLAAALTLASLAPAGAGKIPPPGYRCGYAMRLEFGLTDAGHDRLNRALEWLRFPRAAAEPGMVVVSWRKGRALGGGPGGHVVRIIAKETECLAIVRDDLGTRRRNICSRLLGVVDPEGGLDVSRREPRRRPR